MFLFCFHLFLFIGCIRFERIAKTKKLHLVVEFKEMNNGHEFRFLSLLGGGGGRGDLQIE